MIALSRPLRLTLSVLAILAGMLLCAGVALRQAEQRALAASSAQAEEQLNLYAGTLRTLIDRYRSLPAVLALDPELRRSLRGAVGGELQLHLNRKLERINAAAGSSTLELLDRDGLAVAASNWRTPTSYVGHNFGFRPYFLETRSHGTGRFYAVGVVTGTPGYFLSSAVLDEDGSFLGAIVVRLELNDLEREWSAGPDVLLVSDAKDIAFLANRPGWRYRELRVLTPEERAELTSTRQYDKQPLAPLEHRSVEALGVHSRLERVNGPEGNRDYLWQTLPLSSEGWTLHLLRQPQEALQAGRGAAIGAAGGWLALVFLGLFLHQRWRLARLRQRSREELERLVEERTAALRTAQEGLVQAAKLAALGQMSAALAHEINQPLTAQRMQLASLRLLLEQGREEQAAVVLQRLDEQLERMAALTGHLKTFARKSPGGLRERLDLALVVDRALQLLEARLRSEAVELQLDMARPAWVLGDAIRLEQVLVNLLRNALDAMADKPVRQLRVNICPHGGQWLLEVLDSGGGIAAEHLASVFDPFFTTKPVGEGLGLGLAVSYGIVMELGGSLEAGNRDGGACFSLRLPADLGEE
ncbi:ATP-binding protein [Pseudomonas jinjuensis]|uniref:histidine kinase n=1 Tax=Pseudomonas jinjuensis TaxID=198616 RepID=A0A1H0BTR7_9PSED|nr:ATP-binding protein [Pseudomonas jinjuensis]SDN49044.1 two-component system, NtrC family, C4-dicarboxylate transport sensor histidine kinase DctB [Pseudomonas jinjuensis]